MALRFRRGLESDRTNPSFVPEDGEPVWIRETESLYIGDGSTAGGVLITGSSGSGSTPGIDDNTTGVVLTLDDAVATFTNDVELDSSDLILAGGEITGTGNINILGNITGSGTLTGNIANIGSLNVTAGISAGSVINAPFFDGDLTGSVFRDDSSQIIDAVSGDIYASQNIFHTGALNIESDNVGSIGVVNLKSTNEAQYLKVVRTDAGTASNQNIGLIGFDQVDDTGTTTYGSMAFWHSGIYIGQSSTGSFAATNYFSIEDGNVCMGDFSPAAGYRLDVRGNAIVSGSLEAGSMLLSGSNIDTSDSSAITVTPAVTFSSDVTVENNLIVTNTLTVDTLEVTNFQTAGSGTPELASDTDILLTAGTRVEITQSPLKMASFTTTERNSLTPQNGDVIYNTTDSKFQGYAGGTWVNLH
jgi:hypothetical protein